MERRIILIGKTGNGKSSTGNTLLGRSAFQTDDTLTAVTESCDVKLSDNSTSDLKYTIVDTPGLMEAGVLIAVRLLDVLRSVEICPEPHAFLLIFNSENRMTKDEEYTIDLLRVTFGEEVFDHCIVVFTHGNKFNSEQEFTRFWKQSAMLGKLVDRCGGRIKRIENGSSFYHGNEIIDLVERMAGRRNKRYQYTCIEQHKQVLKQHIERYRGIGDLRHELSVLVYAIGGELNPCSTTWTLVLVGGTIIALGALGAGAGYGILVATGEAVGTASSGPLRATVINGVAAATGAVWSLASRAKFW